MRKNSRNNERETDAIRVINGYELKNPEVRREKERRKYHGSEEEVQKMDLMKMDLIQ